MAAGTDGNGGERRGVAAIMAVAVGSFMLSGCTVGPNYRPPSATRMGVPDQFSSDIAPGADAPSVQELGSWWAALGDPLLGDLVDKALAANPDIEAAGAQLRQARAQYKNARASLFPTLDIGGSAGHTALLGKGSTTFIANPGGSGGTSFATQGSYDQFSGSLDAAYEVDLFGGVRRSIQAARGDYASAAETLRDTQRSIVAEVALDYIDARSAQERLAIARSNLKSQDETVQLVGWRVKAGLVSSLDLAQAKAQQETTAATIPALETSLAQSLNALAILTGQAPGSLNAAFDPPRPVPIADRALGTDVPVAVLAQRPDVRSAERALAAATARIGVAKAQLYPTLKLSGSLGGNGTAIGDIGTFLTGTLLASVSAPIFHGGAIRAQIENARGGADLALANYHKAVLTALSDVENALVSLANSRRRVVTLGAAADDSRNALVFAQSQYRAGLIDFQTLLDSQRTLLSSQDSLAQARADRATALVQLYKALGGGWQAAPLPGTAMPNVPAQIEIPDLAEEPAPIPPDQTKPIERP
ncbi:efflux transporter outer membrane subunit [Sphingomonas oryzagri]|uniref:Efflux transporter outer membrane subunit n=1 Tax=Sphingomonas oryzagri TaxID=3042314 RepID=A0ABT6N456_9SPHN|nr:efflux transporter outer membrane subunit [Sphingomonas oryzagri]MDH7640088.1 efflux transporter outer membrane subunit [Sphingomonas oryzagri]